MKYLFIFIIFVSFSCQGSIDVDSERLKPAPKTDVGSTDGFSDVEGGIKGCGIQEMYTALEPTCANCHRSGTTPYFASGVSFYRLLVAKEKWVIPGQPEKSALIDLLIGEAKGQYSQMPLGEKNYEELAKENDALISVDAVREFITKLEDCTPGEPEEVERVLVRRKSARQIFNALKLHIGIEDSDIRVSGNGNEEKYPIWSPDSVEKVTSGVNVNVFTIGAAQRWHALGGESYLRNIRGTTGMTLSFGQTITQVSQAWCRTGLNKPDNVGFYRHVDQLDLAAATDAEIKQNIKYLMLRFWGHVASDEEVDDMFDNLYSSYSQAENPQTAWVGVCSALIRDPLWLVY